MRNPSTRIPSYRLHRASGQAVVTLPGRDHYLGEHGCPEINAQYRRLIHRFLIGESEQKRPGRSYSVAELCRDSLDYAKQTYRHPNGTLTPTVESVRYALPALFEFAADVAVEKFAPRLFIELRDALASKGLARSTIHDRIKIMGRAFKWAVEQESASPSVFHGLLAVSGLRRGRCVARETEPVRPAPEADIEAALPFMPDPVRAMVKLQLLTGARPGEITAMRTHDIDRSRTTCVYAPQDHTSAWRGHRRENLSTRLAALAGARPRSLT